jgi:hypothetical protein
MKLNYNENYFIKISYLFICFLFLACTGKVNKDKSPLSDFDKTIKLPSVESAILRDDLGELMRFAIKDSLLVYKEYYTKYMCKMFDLNTGKLLHKDIKKGAGPYEMVDCEGFYPYKDDLLYTLTCNGILIFISTEDFLAKRKKFTRVVDLRNYFEEESPMGCNVLNDSIVICEGMFGEERYCMINLNSRKKVYKYNYPLDERSENEGSAIKSIAYQGMFSRKPDSNMFAHVCSKAGIIEIFDFNGNDFNRVFNKEYFVCEYEVRNGRAGNFNRRGFRGISSDSKYIYALYSGRTKEEFGRMEYSYAENLLVYDWDGNAVLQIKLDEAVMNMALEPTDKKVYCQCVDKNTGEPKIVYYDLPKELY